mmetsp:Transcript_36995/g.117852  ORF Transcript_36995/g.117852 Transcript_36995/m.117852 type:complete len:220 (+) Transcript_36995:265-924(+)
MRAPRTSTPMALGAWQRVHPTCLPTAISIARHAHRTASPATAAPPATASRARRSCRSNTTASVVPLARRGSSPRPQMSARLATALAPSAPTLVRKTALSARRAFRTWRAAVVASVEVDTRRLRMLASKSTNALQAPTTATMPPAAPTRWARSPACARLATETCTAMAPPVRRSTSATILRSTRATRAPSAPTRMARTSARVRASGTRAMAFSAGTLTSV